MFGGLFNDVIFIEGSVALNERESMSYEFERVYKTVFLVWSG